MNKNILEKLINESLVTGADFSEIFYEDTKTKKYNLVDSKLDSIDTTYIKGVGIRLAKENDIVYGYTNGIDEENLLDLVKKLRKNFDSNKVLDNVKFKETQYKKNDLNLTHNKYEDVKKKGYLLGYTFFYSSEKFIP